MQNDGYDFGWEILGDYTAFESLEKFDEAVIQERSKDRPNKSDK
jgi:hypothetical protein